MIKRSIPSVIVRIILFWYQTQTACIKWGQYTSTSFAISNGTRQGSVLSPRLFSIYVDGLSHLLIDSKVGCFIDGHCMNHFIYADDICIFAPSPSGLQKLLNICGNFGKENCITFNSMKSVYIVFKPKKFKLFIPDMIFNSTNLKPSVNVKYLGFKLNETLCDGDDILKDLRALYIRSN